MARIATLPGVVAVGATSIPPGDFSNAGDGRHFIDRIPEQRDRDREPPTVMTIVAPGSFAALGIPLKRGRDFNDGDTADRPLVAIVNEALVRKSLGGAGPDRQDHLLFVRSERSDDDRRRRRRRAPAQSGAPAACRNATCRTGSTRTTTRTLNIVVRTAGDPTALAGTVRRVAAEISPDVPVSFTTMEAQVSKGVEDPRFRALLFGSVCRVRGVSGDGGCLWRDGLCRAAAIEGDRPAHRAGRQHGRRCCGSFSGKGWCSPAVGLAVGPGRRRRGGTAARDRALRGAAGRHAGLSGGGRSAGRGDARGGLSSGAASRGARSGAGAQDGVSACDSELILPSMSMAGSISGRVSAGRHGGPDTPRQGLTPREAPPSDRSAPRAAPAAGRPSWRRGTSTPIASAIAIGSVEVTW